MGGLPPYGVKAVVDGYNNFLKEVGGMGKAVQDSHREMGKLGGVSLGGLVSSAGVAVTAVAAIGAAAAAVGLALGGLVIKTAIDAAPLYDIQQAFEGIATAAGKDPAKVLRDLQDAARGTIPAVKLMENFNLASQLLGTSLSEDLGGVIPLIGKVAAATGQDVGQLTNDFIRGIGRESVMILDNLGIQIDLTKVMDDYAASLGITAAELDATQRKTALMGAATAALAKNTEAMPDIADTAAGQFKALQTVFTDVKDEVGMALVPALMPLIQQLGALAKEYLPGLVVMFTEHVLPVIAQVATWLSENLPGAIAAAVAFFGQLQTKGSELGAFWRDVLQPALVAFGTYMSERLAPFLQTLWGILTNLVVPALKLVWQWFSTYLLPVIGTVAHIIGAVLGTAFRVLWGLLTNVIWPAMQKVWAFISEKFGPVFTWLGEQIQKVVEFMQPFLDLLNDWADWMSNIKLPDWLESHSPSKFEQSLWGIADALGTIQSLGSPTIGGQVGGPMRVGGMGAAGAVGAGVSNAFNLTVNTSAPREPIVADFRMMQALSQRR